MQNPWLRDWLAGVYFSVTHVFQAHLRKLLRSRLVSHIVSSVTLESGKFDSSKITVFSVVKNEMVLLPAFLAHHRSLGVEQFLFLVDFSDDGTLEFLGDQEDVVVITSGIKWSNSINVSLWDRWGASKMDHAAKKIREVLTHKYFFGTFDIYLDADEFLFLPPKVSSIREVIEEMRAKRMKSMVASVIEFFPESIDLLRPKTDFGSLSDLISHYPFFESRPLLELRKWCFAREIHIGRTAELFEEVLGKEGISVQLKTPIVFHDHLSFRVGAHVSSLPPRSDYMLTIAHFKLTHDSFEKFKEITESRSHPPTTNRKYDLLLELLQAMEARSPSFLSERSTKFSSVQQFLDIDLMRWPSLSGREKRVEPKV